MQPTIPSMPPYPPTTPHTPPQYRLPFHSAAFAAFQFTLLSPLSFQWHLTCISFEPGHWSLTSRSSLLHFHRVLPLAAEWCASSHSLPSSVPPPPHNGAPVSCAAPAAQNGARTHMAIPSSHRSLCFSQACDMQLPTRQAMPGDAGARCGAGPGWHLAPGRLSEAVGAWPRRNGGASLARCTVCAGCLSGTGLVHSRACMQWQQLPGAVYEHAVMRRAATGHGTASANGGGRRAVPTRRSTVLPLWNAQTTLVLHPGSAHCRIVQAQTPCTQSQLQAERRRVPQTQLALRRHRAVPRLPPWLPVASCALLRRRTVARRKPNSAWSPYVTGTREPNTSAKVQLSRRGLATLPAQRPVPLKAACGRHTGHSFTSHPHKASPPLAAPPDTSPQQNEL